MRGVFDTLAPLIGSEDKMQKIRRGDLVEVVAGVDRGKQGRVADLRNRWEAEVVQAVLYF